MGDPSARQEPAPALASERSGIPLDLIDRLIAATLSFRRSRALRRTSHEMYKVEGVELTPGQVDILEALSTRERWNIGDLSAYLELDPATVSRGIPPLVDLGVAMRDTSGSDRRLAIVSVTPTGRKALVRITERRRYLARKVLVGVSEERVALMVELMEEWLRLNEARLLPGDQTTDRW